MTTRKPRVSPLVPTQAIDRKLDRTHVATPDFEIVTMIEEAVDHAAQSEPRWTPTLKRQAVRYALWRHHRNLADYAAIMNGTRRRPFVPAAYTVQ